MKKILISLLGAAFLASCYQEEQAIDYDYSNGQTMVFVPSRVSFESNVDSIKYYWDETWIATKKEMPFVLEFKIQGQSSGVHTFKYAIYTSGGAFSENSRSITIK